MTDCVRFSVEACRNAFPVAIANPETIGAYAGRLREGAPVTNRTSCLIAPNGRIIYAYSRLDWREHVANTLAAISDFSEAESVLEVAAGMAPRKVERHGEGPEKIEQGSAQTEGGEAKEERFQPVHQGHDRHRQTLTRRARAGTRSRVRDFVQLDS